MSKWLQGALSAATTRPDSGSTVVPITSIDRTLAQIREVTNDLVTVEAERDRIEMAKDNEMREFDAALASNAEHQAAVRTRLRELQLMVAETVKQHGIKAEVVG